LTPVRGRAHTGVASDMRSALAVALALLPAATSADQVFTRAGGQLDGEIVKRGPDTIVVDVGGGTIELPIGYVERIVPGPSPTALFREKAQGLAAEDVAGWLALGRWAREQGLRTQANEAFLHVVSRDPDHAAARQALGHVRLGDEWMSREDSYRARGFVAFDGQWMTPEERETLVAERRAAAEQAQTEAEALARVRETEARAREAEARARVVEAEARIAEVDAGRAESAPLGIQWLQPFPHAGFHPFAPVGFHPFSQVGFRRTVLGGCPPFPHLHAAGPRGVHPSRGVVIGRGGPHSRPRGRR
jgi:hypothetical protein